MSYLSSIHCEVCPCVQIMNKAIRTHLLELYQLFVEHSNLNGNSENGERFIYPFCLSLCLLFNFMRMPYFYYFAKIYSLLYSAINSKPACYRRYNLTFLYPAHRTGIRRECFRWIGVFVTDVLPHMKWFTTLYTARLDSIYSTQSVNER